MWGDQKLMAIKYDGLEMSSLIATVQDRWKAINPNLPFQYSVYSDELDHLYDDENKLSKLINVFSGFSFFIAILGLLGLVSYAVDRRKKELSIRRILGASHREILLLLNKQFFLLLLVGGLVALPISWQLLNSWLSSFAYRTDISIGIFIMAMLVIGVLALGSTAIFILSAINTDPAKTLKEF